MGARRFRPRSARFRAGHALRDVNAGSLRIPFRHARRTRVIWQYCHVPALSGPLATLPGTSRTRLPSASQSCCDRNHGAGLTPPLDQQTPHGAPASSTKAAGRSTPTPTAATPGPAPPAATTATTPPTTTHHPTPPANPPRPALLVGAKRLLPRSRRHWPARTAAPCPAVAQPVQGTLANSVHGLRGRPKATRARAQAATEERRTRVGGSVRSGSDGGVSAVGALAYLVQVEGGHAEARATWPGLAQYGWVVRR
jgi:hypothetical protein